MSVLQIKIAFEFQVLILTYSWNNDAIIARFLKMILPYERFKYCYIKPSYVYLTRYLS